MEIKIHNQLSNGLLGHRVELREHFTKNLKQGIYVGSGIADGQYVCDRIVADDGKIINGTVERVISFGPPVEVSEPLHPLHSELSIYLESNGWKRGPHTFFRNELFGGWLGWEDKERKVFYLGHEQDTIEKILSDGFYWPPNMDMLMDYIRETVHSTTNPKKH